MLRRCRKCKGPIEESRVRSNKCRACDGGKGRVYLPLYLTAATHDAVAEAAEAKGMSVKDFIEADLITRFAGARKKGKK